MGDDRAQGDREQDPVTADQPQTFETFETILATLYNDFTPTFAEKESGVPAAAIEEVAREAARAGSALATHVWRNSAAGNTWFTTMPPRVP